jgi:hypothetical protein
LQWSFSNDYGKLLNTWCTSKTCSKFRHTIPFTKALEDQYLPKVVWKWS